MKLAIREASALRAVRPGDLAAYLRTHGWTEVGTFGGRATVFAFNEAEVLVPVATHYGDFARRIGESLSTVAAVEQRSEHEVWRDVVTASFDLIRVRAVDPDYDRGAMPLEEGVALFARARDLLLAASCAAHDPRPVYHTRKPPQAVEFLRRVQVGQTEAGSYVITLQAPVPPALTQVPLFEEEQEPFERSSTRVLMQALGGLANAAQEASLSREFGPFEAALPLGVSANLCDAVVDMYQSTHAREIEVRMNWAAVRPAPPVDSTPTRVVVPRESVDAIRTASAVLRARRPKTGVEAAGFVVRLQRDDGALLGDITLFGRVGATSRIPRVTVRSLPTHLYDIALQAHKDGVPVRVVGELRKDGRGYALHGVRDVVVDDDALDE